MVSSSTHAPHTTATHPRPPSSPPSTNLDPEAVDTGGAPWRPTMICGTPPPHTHQHSRPRAPPRSLGAVSSPAGLATGRLGTLRPVESCRKRSTGRGRRVTRKGLIPTQPGPLRMQPNEVASRIPTAPISFPGSPSYLFRVFHKLVLAPASMAENDKPLLHVRSNFPPPTFFFCCPAGTPSTGLHQTCRQRPAGTSPTPPAAQ